MGPPTMIETVRRIKVVKNINSLKIMPSKVVLTIQLSHNIIKTFKLNEHRLLDIMINRRVSITPIGITFYKTDLLDESYLVIISMIEIMLTSGLMVSDAFVTIGEDQHSTNMSHACILLKSDSSIGRPRIL